MLAGPTEDKITSPYYIFPELKAIPFSGFQGDLHKAQNRYHKTKWQLSQIADLAKIDKKITNHIARHSFGNIAGEKVSPQMLQKLYRHSSLSTTIGYQANFIHKSSDDALDEILKFSIGKVS